jgi:alpha-ketoglutarate-dependent taurine dioxygenase
LPGPQAARDGDVFPPTIQCLEPPHDLPAWVTANRTVVDGLLREHGVVLLRGLSGINADSFEAVASSLSTRLYGDYGDLPHERDTGHVYKSTPYPASESILFHHESSHMPQWPRRQFFCCIEAASSGGATPIVDGRKVYSALPENMRGHFASAGIRYVRNFTRWLDVSWQDMFGTDNAAEVEARCGAQGVSCEWLAENTLRTQQWAPAVVRHPETGEMVFFNQLLLHHTACLDKSVRETMAELFGEDEMAFPRSASFGDGSPIPDTTVELINDLYKSLAHRFRWERGDVLVLDNMLVAHGRDPFRGSRKILVAMGDMTTRDEFAPKQPS